jgi:hypothetical protein
MDYSYDYSGPGIVAWIFYLIVTVFYIFCYWKIFEKAGKPGWAAIIPIYNILVQLEIIGRPWWWLLLLFVPVANVVIGIMLLFDLAKVLAKEPVSVSGCSSLLPSSSRFWLLAAPLIWGRLAVNRPLEP